MAVGKGENAHDAAVVMVCAYVCVGWGHGGVGWGYTACQPVLHDIVTPRHLFACILLFQVRACARAGRVVSVRPSLWIERHLLVHLAIFILLWKHNKITFAVNFSFSSVNKCWKPEGRTNHKFTDKSRADKMRKTSRWCYQYFFHNHSLQKAFIMPYAYECFVTQKNDLETDRLMRVCVVSVDDGS